MKNSSISMANYFNYKFLSVLFLFVFIGLGQTAFSQSHVIILKGNQKPPEFERHMPCTMLGGSFDLDVYNQGNTPMNGVTVTITMIDTYMNSVTSIGSSFNVINPGGSVTINLPIPWNVSTSSGYFIVDFQYYQNGKAESFSQIISFNICED